ncbi:MAG: hypothetical protein ACO3UU_12355, partial [Minisyncoccia bacterium]
MTVTSESEELHNNTTNESNNTSELSKNMKDSWTMNIERVLDKLRINCCQLSNFHKYKYQHCKSQIKWFRLPIITISSITTFASVGLQEYVKQETISVITSVLSLLVGIISGIEMFMKYQDKMETELITHKEYYKLSIEIYKMISIDRAYRKVSGKDFLEEKFNEYQKIKSHSRPEEPSDLVYDILADMDELFLYKRQSKNNMIGWTNKIEMAPPLYQKESTSLGVSYDRFRNPEKYHLREQSKKLENKTRITQKYIDQRWIDRKEQEKKKVRDNCPTHTIKNNTNNETVNQDTNAYQNIFIKSNQIDSKDNNNDEYLYEKNKETKSIVKRVTGYFSPKKKEYI